MHVKIGRFPGSSTLGKEQRVRARIGLKVAYDICNDSRDTGNSGVDLLLDDQSQQHENESPKQWEGVQTKLFFGDSNLDIHNSFAVSSFTWNCSTVLRNLAVLVLIGKG